MPRPATPESLPRDSPTPVGLKHRDSRLPVPASSLLRKFVNERLNRELPLIDYRALRHYGRLAHCRSIPAIAARKCLLYVLPARIYRQPCPAEGVFVICDHNNCAIPRQFIEFIQSPPYKFRVHPIISDSPLDYINPTSAVMLVGAGRAGARRISYFALFPSCGSPATQIAQRRYVESTAYYKS